MVSEGFGNPLDNLNASAVRRQEHDESLGTPLVRWAALPTSQVFYSGTDEVIDPLQDWANEAQRIRIKARLDFLQTVIELLHHELVSTRRSRISHSIKSPFTLARRPSRR